MDLDAYVVIHQAQWSRLEQLAGQRTLSGAEIDELSALYREVATHLSVIRSSAPDAGTIAYLSSVLAKARQRTGRPAPASRSALADAVLRRFPAALYRTRRWWLSTMLISYALTAIATWWLLQHPEVESAMMSPEQVRQLVDNDFAAYYTESAASEFAAQVWTNNAWVAALCVALGIFGFPVIYLLWMNLSNLAVVASIMIRNDRSDVFFGLILPHGLLELTAVFVAAGVGLRLMWSWVAPGARSRADSVAAEGRSAAIIVLGLVVVLFISGLIEGFVTPSGLPTWARISIGVAAEVAFLAYVFGPGRIAARQGYDGDVAADALEDAVATAR